MYNFKIFDIFLIKKDTSKGKKMSFESSSEDPMDYLKTKGSEKEPLLGGKVAEAPAGMCMFIDISLQSLDAG